MITLARRCLAVCLAVLPAASAAPLILPPVSVVKMLSVPDSAHGLDWNVFTAPDVSPSRLVEDLRHAQPPIAPIDAPPPVRAFAAQTADPLNSLFLKTMMALAFLAVSLSAIPRFHFYRARWKALHLRIPLH